MADLNAKPIADLALPTPFVGPVGFVGGALKFRGSNFHLGRDNADAAEATNDVIRFFRVNSGDIPVMIWFYADQRGNSAVGDLGLYTINAGAVVQVDCLGSGLLFDPAVIKPDAVTADTSATPIATSSVAGYDVHGAIGPYFVDFVNTNNASADDEDSGYLGRIWQHIGLSANPNLSYDLGLKMTTEGTSTTAFIACGMAYIGG